MLKAKVEKIKGMTRLLVNDKITPPVFFYGCTLFPRRMDIVEKEFKLASEYGVDLLSVSLKMGVMHHERQESIDALSSFIDMILKYNKEAKILVRANVSQYGKSARKWEEMYPGEMIAYEHDNSEYEEGKADFDSTMTSVFSKNWQQMAEEATAEFVDYFYRHPLYSNHILGYHIGGNESDEWFHFGYREGGCDISPVAQKYFRKYIKEKYESNIANLREAWGDKNLEFEDIKIPTPIPGNTYRNTYPVYYFKEASEQKYVDYNEMLNKRVSYLIERFASIVKKTTEHNLLVMCFYGYWFELGGDPKSGHFDFQPLLESCNIDGFSSPIGYHDRDTGGTGPYMTPIDSVTAHGKMWFVENDIRTFLVYRREPGEENDPFRNIYNFMDLYEVYKREAGTQMIRGCASWYMDLAGKGWFYHPDIWLLIKHLKNLYQASLDFVSPYVPDLAVVLDEDDTYRMATAHGGFGYTAANLRMTFYRLGVKVGFFTSEDWLAGKADVARLVYLLNPSGLGGNKLEKAKKKVRMKGKTTVFMHSFGAMSQEEIFELTGMKMVEYYSPKKGEKLDTNMEFTSIFSGMENTSPGRSLEVNPLFYIDDASVTEWAKYTMIDKTAFGIKEGENWQTVFFGGFELDKNLLSKINDSAGIFQYGYFGDYIQVSNEIIVNHTTSPGNKTVYFKEKCDVYDYFENQWYENVSSISKDLDLGKTNIYFYGKRQDILKYNLPRWPKELF